MEYITDNKLQKLIKHCENQPSYWKELIKLTKQHINFQKQLADYYYCLLNFPDSNLNKSVRKYMQSEIIIIKNDIDKSKELIKKYRTSLKSLKNNS